MSTKKVEQYKNEKKNRKDTLKKQKRQKLVARILVGVVCVALVGWIGWSGYRYFTKDKEGTDAENVHTAAIDNYVNEELQRVEATP